MAAGFFIAVCGCIIVMFVPKTNLIFSGAQIDDNLKIVHGAKRQDGSSASDNVVSQLRDKIRNKTRGAKSSLVKKSSMRYSDRQLESIGENGDNDKASSLATPTIKKTLRIYRLTSGKIDSEHQFNEENNNSDRVTDISGSRVHSEFLAENTSGKTNISRFELKSLKTLKGTTSS
eukprot:gene15498-32762_t